MHPNLLHFLYSRLRLSNSIDYIPIRISQFVRNLVSTTKAEYITASLIAKEAIWLRKHLNDI